MTPRLAIRLDHVHKVYPGPVPVSALVDVSLAVAVGRLVAVEGPSGSGKTTLLSLLGGLDRPTRGAIAVLGADLAGLREGPLAAYRRDVVGFVFQDFKLLDALTATENVALALRLRGSGRAEARARSRALLADLGLEARRGAMPRELSGGEKQRVAIARAAVTGAPLLLADEPTANVDGASAAQIVLLLRRLSRACGTTVVVASHDARVAAAADEVVRLADGRLLDSPAAEDAP